MFSVPLPVVCAPLVGVCWLGGAVRAGADLRAGPFRAAVGGEPGSLCPRPSRALVAAVHLPPESVLSGHEFFYLGTRISIQTGEPPASEGAQLEGHLLSDGALGGACPRMPSGASVLGCVEAGSAWAGGRPEPAPLQTQPHLPSRRSKRQLGGGNSGKARAPQPLPPRGLRARLLRLRTPRR